MVETLILHKQIVYFSRLSLPEVQKDFESSQVWKKRMYFDYKEVQNSIIFEFFQKSGRLATTAKIPKHAILLGAHFGLMAR